MSSAAAERRGPAGAIPSGCRGRPPVTSRAEIVVAALAVARRDGLDALTVKGLAREMGLAPATLYNYGTTKGDILAMMVDVAMSAAPSELDQGQPWQLQLRATMLGFYDLFLEHYVLIELLVRADPAADRALVRARDTSLDRITGMPLGRAEARELFDVLGAVVVGVAVVNGSRSRRPDGRTGSTARAGRVRQGLAATLDGIIAAAPQTTDHLGAATAAPSSDGEVHP